MADQSLYDRLRAKLKTVKIENETYYVAEGDTLLDEPQLKVYAQQREAAIRATEADRMADEAGIGLIPINPPQRMGLLGMTKNGKLVRWPEGQVLTYRVVKNSFKDYQQYHRVVDAVTQATTDWEKVCGVKFQHLSSLDTVPGLGAAGALFPVRLFDAGGAFIAAAFFPTDSVNRRHVLIDPSFFAPDLIFNPVGVLRHELGHVLGFRHEHIRRGAPPDCPGEELDGAIDLTKYDPTSVMHYFCGNLGSKELLITNTDQEGAQKVYGPPLK